MVLYGNFFPGLLNKGIYFYQRGQNRDEGDERGQNRDKGDKGDEGDEGGRGGTKQVVEDASLLNHVTT